MWPAGAGAAAVRSAPPHVIPCTLRLADTEADRWPLQHQRGDRPHEMTEGAALAA